MPLFDSHSVTAAIAEQARSNGSVRSSDVSRMSVDSGSNTNCSLPMCLDMIIYCMYKLFLGVILDFVFFRALNLIVVVILLARISISIIFLTTKHSVAYL